MKKWPLLILAATLSSGAATVPAFADSTPGASGDQAYMSQDYYTPTVGTNVDLRIAFHSATNSATPALQVTTSLGSLNGQGAALTLQPSDLNAPVVLSSTKAGIATVTVKEGDAVIGSLQVTFLPGPVSNVTVQANPYSPLVGSPSTVTIMATDQYGNPVQDNVQGSTFEVTASQGTVSELSGLNPSNDTQGFVISTHNGMAQVLVNDTTAGTVNLTVKDLTLFGKTVEMNGAMGVISTTVPLNFGYPDASLFTAPNDFSDLQNASAAELSAVRELTLAGVVHGYTDHSFHPNELMTRSEFSTMVAEYMGLGSLASTLNGTTTTFPDVPTIAWYDGAVNACYTFGYFKGDGTYFHPNQTITYAEVAQVLLNNLGIATPPNSWPNGAMETAKTYNLFSGITGTPSATVPATRGNIAIMVRNALHQFPGGGSSSTGTTGLMPLSTSKTLESQTISYTWYGTADQPAVVTSVPINGLNQGNVLQVELNGAASSLQLANNVVVAGASTMNDLIGKKIQYLVNPLGLVSYIEVTP